MRNRGWQWQRGRGERRGTARRLGIGVEDWRRDAATAGRMLRRRPGFTALAIATLALGIGVTTAMYSVVRTVILDPLPFPDAARLVQVNAVEKKIHGRTQDPDGLYPLLNNAAILALRKANIFASVGTITWMVGPAYVHGYATSGEIFQASPDLFRTLGITPVLGRGLSGQGGEALVGYNFYRKELGGQRSALGQTIRIKDHAYTIVGVLGAGELYPQGEQTADSVWVGNPLSPDACKEYCEMIARLRGNLSLPVAHARAEAAVTAVGKHVKLGSYAMGLTLAPLRPSPGPALALWVLFAAAACLLLIACGNTANLLLARGLERQRELAVRRALGASRGRLVRLLLAEGAWLALSGGLAGVGLAWVLVHLARRGPASVPRLAGASVDPSVLGLAAALAVGSGLLCALAPAMRFSRRRGALASLHDSDRATHRQRARQILVVGEIAITLVLLIGGVLLVRTFLAMERTGLGFNPHQVTEIRVWFPQPTTGPQTSSAWKKVSAREAFVEQAVLARARALPGVSAAGSSHWRPLGPVFFNSTLARAETPKAHIPAMELDVGWGFFQTLGFPLLAGRGFTPRELAWASPSTPVVINAAAARQLWPGRALGRALGSRLNVGLGGNVVVVGVVGNIRNAPGKPPAVTAYLPMGHTPFAWTLYLRSGLPPAELGREVHDLLPSVSSGLTMSAPVPLMDKLNGLLEQPRFRALLLAGFGGLAWALALVGLYGVLAFSVRQRSREIGIRVAFGAGKMDVLRLVFSQSCAVLAAGIGIGWLLSWYLCRYVGTLLYGVGALNAATWLGAAAALAAAGLLASYIPARRALRVDPADTLRCE